MRRFRLWLIVFWFACMFVSESKSEEQNGGRWGKYVCEDSIGIDRKEFWEEVFNEERVVPIQPDYVKDNFLYCYVLDEAVYCKMEGDSKEGHSNDFRLSVDTDLTEFLTIKFKEFLEELLSSGKCKKIPF